MHSKYFHLHNCVCYTKVYEKRMKNMIFNINIIYIYLKII